MEAFNLEAVDIKSLNIILYYETKKQSIRVLCYISKAFCCILALSGFYILKNDSDWWVTVVWMGMDSKGCSWSLGDKRLSSEVLISILGCT